MERNKGGRPYLGVRKRLPVRVPEKLAEQAQAEAARRGIAFNEFVVQLIASAIDGQHPEQEALELNLTHKRKTPRPTRSRRSVAP